MTEIKDIDKRHGGAWDRGVCDSYYGRGSHPHLFKGATYASPKVEKKDMTDEDVEAYVAGFRWNEEFGDHKVWE